MLLLYENIKKRREELGMSKAHLADLIGYDRSMITKIEQGKVDLTQSKIIAFAGALQTTPCWLMGWDEQVNKPQNSLSPHENKVITAYRNQPDTQPFVDKLLGVEREEETFNIAKAARNQKPIKMTREQEKAFAESANKAPNSSQRRDMF